MLADLQYLGKNKGVIYIVCIKGHGTTGATGAIALLQY